MRMRIRRVLVDLNLTSHDEYFSEQLLRMYYGSGTVGNILLLAGTETGRMQSAHVCRPLRTSAGFQPILRRAV